MWLEHSAGTVLYRAYSVRLSQTGHSPLSSIGSLIQRRIHVSFRAQFVRLSTRKEKIVDDGY